MLRRETNWPLNLPRRPGDDAADPTDDRHPDIDVVDAYEIQLINIRQRVAEGARVVGHKVGLSSEAMQKMMGVEEPDYGHLLSEMECFEDQPVAAGATCSRASRSRWPSFWPTICPAPAAPRMTSLAATAAFAPSIEIIDTRIKDWKISLCDTIADNASSGGFVLGRERVSPKDIDVNAIEAVLSRTAKSSPRVAATRRSGQPCHRGGLVGPARSTASACDSKAGDIILPGSCTRAIDARPARVSSPISPGWGSVRCRSTRGASMAQKKSVAIVGSGNISTDLLYKLLRSGGSSRAG